MKNKSVKKNMKTVKSLYRHKNFMRWKTGVKKVSPYNEMGILLRNKFWARRSYENVLRLPNKDKKWRISLDKFCIIFAKFKLQ